MRLSNSYFFTKREDVKDEEAISGNLLVRSGMIKKAGSGIYIFLPLGLKVLRKIENVIREEMNSIGSQELVMPGLIPEEYFVHSGRNNIFGDNMFSLHDRVGRGYVLGPTHEELFIDVCKDMIRSYKDMPISLYQVANKYRDEVRSRYGLIRTREFLMNEAYSFDKDLEELDHSYQLMFDAYKKIFDRLGLHYKIVRASTGAMGGILSEEFQAITDIGEDVVVTCSTCNLATNIEICPCTHKSINDEDEKDIELINTPNCGTIGDITAQYSFSPKDICKTMIYKVDGEFYAFMVRGDREINEYKIAQLFGAKNVNMATISEDEEITGASVGFAGPIGLSIPVVVDTEVMGMRNFIVGANKTDYHYKNVNLKDFEIYKSADIRNVCEDDCCPECGGGLEFKQSIEIGNTFKLGTKNSEAMDLLYTDIDNQLKPVYMGSYGIGIARLLAAIIEQHHDENGIVFPDIISPFDIEIVIVDMKDEEQVRVGNELYELFQSKGKDVLLDDREERAGIKFKDSDLIGISKRIVVGRGISSGLVEVKVRSTGEVKQVSVQDIESIC